MPHDLCIDADGKAEMMCVGDMPWHGLGTRLASPPTAEQAIRAARLDWRVAKKPLFIGNEHRPLPGQYAIVREDRWNRNEDGLFGTVGRSYTPLQNVDAFGFFDPVVKTGAAFYESAGALKKGERVWVMARLRDDFQITSEDTIARFLLLSNTHDGTGSVQVKFTPVRVVCRNTLNEALMRGPAVRFAHTPDMKEHLNDAAQVVLKAIQQHFDELCRRFRAMRAVEMTKANLQEYINSVFPNPSTNMEQTRLKKAMAQVQRDREESARLFEQGKGNNFQGVRGTLWAAYNGVTEYVDFHRTDYGDGKWLENVWFGSGSALKARALAAANALAPAN